MICKNCTTIFCGESKKNLINLSCMNLAKCYHHMAEIYLIQQPFLVRLSLLTMTNPNQLCDVLLFVCSKIADETNLSSKLPVADRTREV